MSHKDYWLLTMLAVVAGLVGGSVTSWVLVSGPVFAQKQSSEIAKVIEAEGFHLIDKNGVRRARLGLSSNGKPHLILFDKSNKVGGISIQVDPPSIVFGDTIGQNRAWFGLGGDEDPILELRDKNYQRRITLRADRLPTLTILDQEGKVA